MRITSGRGAIVFLVLLAVAGVAWSIMPRPVLVEVAVVTKGRFIATVDEDGKTRVRERYVVSAPLTGRSSRVQLKVGDRVKEGDVVATIIPSPAPFLDPRSRREAQERLGAAEAALERAKALVERAKAQTIQADQEYTRTRTLVERGASTTQALERAELAKRVANRDLRAAEFQLHAAEHELDQASALLARYTDGGKEVPETWNVTAPVGGVVLKVTQESETIVQPGSSMLEIGDPRDLEVVVDVLSTDAVEIRPGAQVTIEHWGGPSVLAGRVRRVEPAAFTKVSTLGVEEQRVNVLIDIVSPPDQWSGLGDAYQVDAKIVVFTQDDATIIPAGALFRRGGSWNVFVVEDGRARVREVSLLRRSGRIAATSEGLGAADQVIVYPSDRVSDGTRIEQSP
ncbi:MAG: HlyD family efflux transporter periplasmic adaptor subunit [Pseudorhodoplanes sp.]|nr:HlyD family efflux transporter periplasmic adaptor subunit [Pseudorhodoplanes sp.]